MDMAKVITDGSGERVEAGLNDSSEEAKEKRRMVAQGKP
jgi:hypothetical protein